MSRAGKEIKWETNEKGCHLVTSHRIHRGRPYIKRDGKSTLLYRWLWIQEYGLIPEGKVLMHSCDNPRCINLKHLSLGTQADNIADMDMKGRRNSVGPKVKYIPQNNIRKFREKKGLSISGLAKEIGVSASYVSRIEKQERKGTNQILESISKILEVPMSTLLEDE